MPHLPTPHFDRADLLGNASFDPRWPTIGPHEGREAWLMALGWKPAAYFCDGADIEPSDQEQVLMLLAEKGVIERHERRLPNPAPLRFHVTLREAIYVLPGRSDLVARLHQISQQWANRRPDFGYRLEFACGDALGYCPTDVSHFIWRTFGRVGGR